MKQESSEPLQKGGKFYSSIFLTPILLLTYAFLGELSISTKNFGAGFFWASFYFCVIYLIIIAFENISHYSKKRLTVIQALIRIGASILSGIIFFGLAYFYVNIKYPGSFEGPMGSDRISQFISFQYFSFMTMTSGNLGEIYPVLNVARLVVVTEIIYVIATIVFIGTNFSGIQKYFKKSSPFA